MQASDWLSIVAIALSVVAIAWNFLLTWLRWPRIAVVVQQIQIIAVSNRGSPPKARSDTFQVTIVNRGSEAVTIQNIGMRDETHKHSVNSKFLGELSDSTGPESALPTRIEGHGHIVWSFAEESLATFPHLTRVYGYASA
jgi:hypothetical protein